MSAIASSLFGTAASILSNALQPVPQGLIDTIPVQATFEETGTDLVTVTDHPVEAGAHITDHAYYRPAELRMQCGWSNSSPNALVGAVQNLFSGGGLAQFAGLSQLDGSAPPVSGGGMSVSDYVSDIYSQLLSLQQSLQPFTVTTSIRRYANMVFASLTVTRDQKTSQALMVTASFRQVIIVNTVTTTLAPIANLANPASNASTVTLGPQSVASGAAPAPGGNPGPENWL